MATIKGVRERARAEITAEIVTEARRQLATVGASGLSLRAIARELGMVSSGIYRYVANRDALLTLLIIDAYDTLGAEAERAADRSTRQAPAKRWGSVGQAIRRWAVANPHEYALIYGSPVPGYEAPSDTIDPASRVSMALIGVVVDAHRGGQLRSPNGELHRVSKALRKDLETALAELGIDLPPEIMIRLIAAWSQMFGMISFELFGQTQNVITAHDELFDSTAALLASHIGLPA